MNKVVSIEIAGQVFWIDDDAYQSLSDYLQQIRHQLKEEEFAKDIFKDIELRVAEILYELRSHEKKAVTIEQIEEVIEQVGFIDGEPSVEELPRRTYRDQQNKILAGVCSGLAQKMKVPAFLIRLIFIALTALFGLGAILYLIFWISLERNDSRSQSLAAEGKAQTATHIANVTAPKENPVLKLQRIIFLPVSIIGALVSVFSGHFKKRSQGYFMIFKNLIAAGLIILTISIGAGIYEFNTNKMFSTFTTWILSAAVIYLVSIGLLIFFRQFYLPMPRRSIDKRLKVGAAIPAALILFATIYINMQHRFYSTEDVSKTFTFAEKQVTIHFNEALPEEEYARMVDYRIRTNPENTDQVKLKISYSASGTDQEDVKENIQSIDYYYTFENNTLKLDKFWKLKEDSLRRGQYVDVVVEVPQNVQLTSSWPLVVTREEDGYQYYTRRYYSDKNDEATTYFSRGEYLHEYGEKYRNKLSDNEIEVLKDKFCDEFFISESWSCSSNIYRSVSENSRFDKAFLKDSDSINQIREFLQPDRSVFVSNLAEIDQLVKDISVKYAVKGKFQSYLEHLIVIKSEEQDTVSLVSSN